MTVTSSDAIVILVDTRERQPWEFAGPTEIVGLDVGDYTVRGLEHLIRLERKSLSDIIGCITTGRERFKRSLRRMQAYRFRGIAIECDWSAITSGTYRSNVNPASVTGSLISWSLDFDVPVWLLGNREAAESFAGRWLSKAAMIVTSENLSIGVEHCEQQRIANTC